MNLIEFVNELALTVLPGVNRVYDDLPKVLFARDLPAQWVDMPSTIIDPTGAYSVFQQSGVRRTVQLFVAVTEMGEGFPADQRTAVLEMAQAIEAWAVLTTYRVELITALPIPVANMQYRGVVARITADDDL